MNFSTDRDTLDAVEKANATLLKAIESKCSWEIPEDVAAYKRDGRIKQRAELLDKLVPNRICPTCRKMKINPRQWVLCTLVAVCRSCYHSMGGEMLEVDFSLAVMEREVRYKIECYEISRIRQLVGLSKNKLGKQMGWSGGYQSQLEKKTIVWWRASDVKTFLRIIRENGGNPCEKTKILEMG